MSQGAGRSHDPRDLMDGHVPEPSLNLGAGHMNPDRDLRRRNSCTYAQTKS